MYFEATLFSLNLDVCMKDLLKNKHVLEIVSMPLSSPVRCIIFLFLFRCPTVLVQFDCFINNFS